ncbi:uncharacterized protein Z519_11196 [Cladophialophora bantiana CBS 173.52]|uniref:Transcription factor domain-containing protein n=1 Tax=Cladophialophora bantiana (strain ATCC 10958 / CBS 173.52 / CDC B-1940 / NIH 8579) TaxID=1442370 RepID=A0A0D2EDA6_CLAB1|nr:uncharacterized protein Z519_11196 [Cladophialophora bantiana CBS 173.52]KIW88086.1 hypothetical protein Z519_11196 [Cladophialophora bantiana CBS 173.52]
MPPDPHPQPIWLAMTWRPRNGVGSLNNETFNHLPILLSTFTLFRIPSNDHNPDLIPLHSRNWSLEISSPGIPMQSRINSSPQSHVHNDARDSGPARLQETSAGFDNKSSQDSEDEIDWREAALNSLPPPCSPNSSASPTFDRTWPASEASPTDSPVSRFVKLAPSCLSRADLNYLHQKGACSLPDEELRDALIESYIDYIHPCYPFLDLDLLDKALCGNSDQQFILPVLRAVMFAGASWVDIKIITRVLLKAYHETSTGNIDILYFNSFPKHRRTHIEPRELREIEDDFRGWLENAPSEVLHVGPMPSRSDADERALFVHRALLSILYHTGFVLIHRQRSLPSGGPDERNAARQIEGAPRAIVRKAAIQVNKIIMDAYAADVMKEMPPNVISCLFPISISHITHMKSDDPMLRYEGRQRLEECRQALRELVDGHLAAEWAVNFLNYVESKLNAAPDLTKRASAVVCGKAPSTVQGKMSLTGYDQRQRWEQDRCQNAEGETAIQAAVSEGPKSIDLAPTNLDEQLNTAHNPFLYVHTPDVFSDLVNFPDTWLGGPDVQNSASSGPWVENDTISMSFA